MTLPAVEVLIPTHNRPELLAKAIDSVLAQRYDGALSIAVIFDRQEPDAQLAQGAPLPIRLLTNDRTPGLAGARNSGIVSSQAELVAFLDDDDQWLPDKLSRQVDRLLAEPAAFFSACSVRFEFNGASNPRLAGTDSVTHVQLLRSRMAMLHSSTFLIRRAALLGELGLVDESSPSSQSEDWDLLLRASALRPIAHLDEPLVAVRWGSSSLFASAWESKIEAARWILGKNPDIRTSAVGYARLLGQIAFAQAALRQRRAALATATHSVRVRWREPRAYLAAAAASGLVKPETVLKVLHRRGHGI